MRGEIHLRYQFLLFLENSVIYHSNCNYSLTRASLIRLVGLVHGTPFSLALTKVNLVKSFSSFIANKVIQNGVFGLAALFCDCKLNLKFVMEYPKFGRSFMEKIVIKLDRAIPATFCL